MQIAKWGNSLAVRLPRELVRAMGLRQGDDIRISAAADHQLQIEKLDRRSSILERMGNRNFQIPGTFQFDRDDANAR